MKLSQPAGSSDLDQARSIARRLTAKLQPRGSGALPAAPAGSVVFGSAPREPRMAAEPVPAPPVPREAEPYAAPEPELAVAPEHEPFPQPEPEASPLPASVDSLVESLVGAPPQELDPLAVLTGGDAPLEVDLPAPEPPSWEEILERCQNLAQARAALLIDGEGRVAASCGTWPAAGAEAVAAKLMSMLDKKEQSGAAASLSVRLAERILTAWRPSLGEARATVAFLADVPIGADLRPTIEDELGTGRL